MSLVILGRALQFALLLLTLRLATSILPPSEMGKISIVTATVAFFALLLLNPVGMFMNRRLHAWNLKGQVANYLTYFWRYLLMVNVFSALALIALIGLKVWTPSISIYWLLVLVCGNLIFGTLNQVVIPGLNLLGYRGWFIFLTVATTGTSLIFAVLLAFTISPVAESWLSGLLIGQLIFGFIGKKIYYGKLQRTNIESNTLPKLSHLHIKSLLKYTWPVAVAVGLGWIQSQGYRYLMQDGLGLTDLGLFVAGYGISAGLISGFDSIFSTYFQPKFYKRISNDNVSEQSHAWIEYAQAILPSLLLTTMFIIATAPELTHLLLGSAYKQSTQFVIWGALAELARVATGVFAMVAHARMNTKLLLLPNFMGAVISVILIWYLMPSYGSQGVGLGLVTASVVTLLFTVYVTKNHLAVVLPFKHFIQSLIMGGGLFLAEEMLRKMLAFDGSHLFSFMRLCLIGIIFILFQYLMLLPVMRREVAYSNN